MGELLEKNDPMRELEKLTDEQLIELYQTDNPEAIEVLLQRYKKFVRQKIKSNFFVGADKEDLIQEGMIGLYKAICDYKHDKEVTFKAFASVCITRQISTAFKTATRQKHMPLNTSISLNLPVASEDEDSVTLMDLIKDSDYRNPEVMIIHKEGLEQLKKRMKAVLSEYEWQVLEMHTQGENYHIIAKKMNKSSKSIDNALQRIKRKLSENTTV